MTAFSQVLFGIIIIILIMVISKCYFSGEIAHSYKKKTNNNNNGLNVELWKTNRLKALCMIQIKKWNKQSMCQ